VTPFEVYDLSDLDWDGQTRRMPELTAEMQASLDLAVGPLVRVALIKLGGLRPDRLAVVAHHLAVDAVSMRILLEDLQTALAQLANGGQVTLPAKTTSWQSWARRLAGYAATEPVQSQREYWSDLVAAPTGELPLDTPADGGTDTVATARTVTASLDTAQTDELLRAVPDAHDCRIDELLLTALSRSLSGWSGAPRHLVDLERHDREQIFDDVDLTRTVGWFSRTHPVALACDPGSSAKATLKTVKEALRAVPAGGIGWQLLRQAPDPVPDAPVQLAFTYLGQVDQPASSGFAVAPEPIGADASPRGRRPYAIEVLASVAGGKLLVRWRYSERLHQRQTVQRLADRYLDELRAMIEQSRRPAEAVPTPSDFPLARVDQEQLSELLGRL
jgi:non-ribosomal peptide synthase protein (TIGR01720 family)